MPVSELPSAERYLREHSAGQILQRVGSGFEDMAIESVQMYEYLPYLVLYLTAGLIVAVTRPNVVRPLLRANRPLVVFLLLYAVVYLFAIAFYYPTSGTGTARFLLAHLTQLFFAISYLLSRQPVSGASWHIGRLAVGVRHFHLFVFSLLALDVAFHVWPRLMTTYGGF